MSRIREFQDIPLVPIGEIARAKGCSNERVERFAAREGLTIARSAGNQKRMTPTDAEKLWKAL